MLYIAKQIIQDLTLRFGFTINLFLYLSNGGPQIGKPHPVMNSKCRGLKKCNDFFIVLCGYLLFIII